MNNEIFYIIMLPVVIGLFIYAYVAERRLAKAIKNIK